MNESYEENKFPKHVQFTSSTKRDGERGWEGNCILAKMYCLKQKFTGRKSMRPNVLKMKNMNVELRWGGKQKKEEQKPPKS